ncbi:threonine efflux protein [Arthrobacter sp. Hiyo8]|nr:threonine efflux protein [Arthrobacter sp. Hiyo8]
MIQWEHDSEFTCGVRRIVRDFGPHTGPDSFLVLRYSLSNVKAGLSAGLGSSLGSIFWAGLVGIGLAALLEQSAEAYRVVKIIGRLYLVYLGISAFIHSRRGQPAHQEQDSVEAGPKLRSTFLAGLVSCMLNPKVACFSSLWCPSSFLRGKRLLD